MTEKLDEGVDVMLDGPGWLVIETRIERVGPMDALRWFREPSLLARWWGDEYRIEPVPGGRYEVSWPRMNWTLRGQVLMSTPDQLVYSWSWDHEPELPARMVVVRGEADGDGTRLTIAHGPYRPNTASWPREDEDRASHRDGWLFFLPKLRAEIAASATPE